MGARKHCTSCPVRRYPCNRNTTTLTSRSSSPAVAYARHLVTMIAYPGRTCFAGVTSDGLEVDPAYRSACRSRASSRVPDAFFPSKSRFAQASAAGSGPPRPIRKCSRWTLSESATAAASPPTAARSMPGANGLTDHRRVDMHHEACIEIQRFSCCGGT